MLPLLAVSVALAQQAGNTGGATSMNPDLAFITDVGLAWYSADESLQTGAHDPALTGFNFQQLELAIESSVDPYFHYDANLVFSQFGVEVEEAYATTLSLPGRTQLRAGQLLTRFGRINATHPHVWSFVDQPFAIGRVFGGEGNRGVGVEGSVLLPLPWYVELVASQTSAGGASTARSFYGGEDLGVDTPLDFQTTLAAEQFFPFGDDLSLIWGLSYAGGPNASGRRNRSEVYGADVYLKYRPITRASFTQVALQGELFYRRRQVPADVLQDLTGYGQLTWQFARRWGVGARYEYGSPAIGLDGEIVTDPLDPEWRDDRHAASLAGTFWPTEFSRIRLQTGIDAPTWLDAPVWGAILNFEVAVGAHGAHTL